MDKTEELWICDHEATWSSIEKIKDNDTIWVGKPRGATGCKLYVKKIIKK